MAEVFYNVSATLKDNWPEYLANAQIPSSRYILLALINIPVLAVVLNVLRQLVRLISLLLHQLSFILFAAAPGYFQASRCFPLASIYRLCHLLRQRPA